MQTQEKTVLLCVVKDSYQTLSADAVAEFKSSSSRFIAYAYNIETPAQAEFKLKSLRAEHHSARHICYAYRIGVDGEITRCNDDGEPSGTAGRPIMGALLSAGVSYVLVAVVRYFGGVLLGTSGLINAYSTASAAALEAAGQRQIIVGVDIIAKVDYPLLNSVMKIIKRRELQAQPVEYCGEKCAVVINVRLSELGSVTSELETIENIKII